MYSRKLSSLVLAVFTSIALEVPSVSSTDQQQHRRQLVGAPVSVHPQVADGGAPVPPVPTPIPTSNLTADGGAPVPPVPHVRPANLMADGGAPVPPVPKPPMTRFVAV